MDRHPMQPTSRRPTLADIAHRCSVSKATVSRALSLPRERCPISAELQERIQTVARELGYHMNWRARAFAKGRTGLIGLLYGQGFTVADGIYRAILESLSIRLSTHDSYLVLTPIHGASGYWQAMLHEQRFDACVAIEHLSPEIRQVVHQARIPTILINGRENDDLLTNVQTDDAQGSTLACAHLLALGHRRLGFYYSGSSWTPAHPSVELRRRAFEDTARAAGASVESVIGSVDDMIDVIVSGRLTGVLAYAHLEAACLLAGMADRGIQCPQDVSLIGTNDLHITELVRPQLTVVRLPSRAMGDLAADLLAKRLRGETVPATSVLPQSLVIRASTGRAAE